MKTSAAGFLTFCLFTSLIAPLSQAQQICTWKGGTNLWTESAQWTNGVPGPGDTAIIAAGIVQLAGDTEPLASFEIKGGTLLFTNWSTRLIATDIRILGGTVTHALCDTNASPDNTNRVFLSASNVFIGSSGKIIADYRGYRGGSNSISFGQGPGGAKNGGGAGYGGAGVAASGNANGAGGPVYGSAEEPTDPGSGGGGTAAFTATAGRPGGGAVRIEATGTVTVNGTITANALRDGLQYLAGKGSGGSVFIRCRQFASTNGIIRADGGENSGTYWLIGTCGGGGRIAIVYDLASQAELNLTQKPQVYLSADGGNWINHGGLGRDWHKGRPGSIYLPDAGFFPGSNMLHGGRIEIPGFTSWSPDSLTISNGLAQFPAGFTLSVTGDLTTAGNGGGIEVSNVTLQVGGNLLIKSDMYGYTILYANQNSLTAVAGDTRVDRGEISFHAAGANGNNLSIGGNCTVTNSGRIRVFSYVTNGVLPDYGALITIDKDLSIATGSWIFAHASSTNGGAPLFRMQNLSVQTNAGFNAVGLGFAGGFKAIGGIPAWGPGAGGVYGGGGHGGKGGRTSGGVVNGSLKTPLNAGSGGGPWANSNGDYGGAGGGVIRLEIVNSLALDGTLNATGESRGDYGAGGAGGSIYVRCRKLSGGGLFRADGGNARLVDGSGSGGGGRIAIWRAIDTFTGSYSVTNGTGVLTYQGEPGTVHWEKLSAGGSLLLIR
jgi:hypothetical protein